MQLWAIIIDTFRESRDRTIFWVMLGISIIVAVAMMCVGIHSDHVDLFFGLHRFETDFFKSSWGIRHDRVASIAVEYITDLVLGWVGIILAIIATAGFLPTMLERGTVDVLLAKPLPRWKLFLGKYIGGLVFVLFQATVFVGLIFVVLATRWNTWLPKYLLVIPLIVLLFSYLYCISAFAAVRFRGTVACVLVTLGAWVVFTGIQSLDDYFFLFPKWQKQKVMYTITRSLWWAVPKTQDITYKARKWTGAADTHEILPPAADEESQDFMQRLMLLEKRRVSLPALHTIGSSLAFEAFVLILAMRSFSRKDY